MDLVVSALLVDVHGVSPAATSFFVMPALADGVTGTGRNRDLFVRIVTG
jgi:hypothetical protein